MSLSKCSVCSVVSPGEWHSTCSWVKYLRDLPSTTSQAQKMAVFSAVSSPVSQAAPKPSANSSAQEREFKCLVLPCNRSYL